MFALAGSPAFAVSSNLPSGTVDEIVGFGQLCIELVQSKKSGSELFPESEWGERREYEARSEKRVFVRNKNVSVGVTYGEPKRCIVTGALTKSQVESESTALAGLLAKLEAQITTNLPILGVEAAPHSGLPIFKTEAFSVELDRPPSLGGGDKVAFQIVINRNEPISTSAEILGKH